MKLSKLLPIVVLGVLALSRSNGSALQATASCNVPEIILTKIKGVLAYQNRDQTTRARVESYTAVNIGERWFFRSNNPLESNASGLRPVMVYEASKELSGADLQCPADVSWVECALAWDPYSFLRSDGKGPTSQQVPAGPSCEVEVAVPKWAPSPESKRKRQIATELLEEFQNQNSEQKLETVYVRDFNLNDPVIHVYSEDSVGKSARWYEFDSTTRPHMSGGSGAYGTVTVEATKRWFMRQPYRLFPPPIGRP